MKRSLPRWIAAAVGCLLFGSPVRAEFLPGPPAVLDGTKYVYGLRLNGIPTARADADLTIRESDRGPLYGLHVVGRTLPVVRLIYPVTSHMRAEIGSDQRSVSYNLWRQTRSSTRETQYAYDPDAQTVQIFRTKGNETIEESVRPSEGLVDPASLLMQAYSVAGAVGDTREIQLLLEGTVYRLNAEVIERGDRHVLGRNLQGFCVASTATKINEDGTEEEVTKVRNVRMWFSDDDLRLPLSITATASFGRITVQLAQVTPSLDSLYAAIPGPHTGVRAEPGHLTIAE